MGPPSGGPVQVVPIPIRLRLSCPVPPGRSDRSNTSPGRDPTSGQGPADAAGAVARRLPVHGGLRADGVQGPKSQTSQIYFPADVGRPSARVSHASCRTPAPCRWRGRPNGRCTVGQFGRRHVRDGPTGFRRPCRRGAAGSELNIKTRWWLGDGYGSVLTIVPLGQRTLDGPSATVYAMYLAPRALGSIASSVSPRSGTRLPKLPPRAEKVRHPR